VDVRGGEGVGEMCGVRYQQGVAYMQMWKNRTGAPGKRERCGEG
jgi:hypothetical protein